MLEKINAVVWAIAMALILLASLYFTVYLNFPQYKIKSLFSSLKNKSSIKKLSLSLAGRIGVGSISGIALAIHLSGPGTIFWMWVTAFITASLAYAETILSLKFQKKEKEIHGGPFYYISEGLKKTKLAKFYALILLISYIIGFMPIQTNTITKAISSFITVDKVILGVVISTVIFVVIKGGIKKIRKISNIIIPVLTIFYIGVTMFSTVKNFEATKISFINIINSAFQLKPFLTSFIPMVIVGMQRCIFSNEAGIGIGTIAACSSEEKNPKKCANIQILGIYFTTLIICTSTAIIILSSNYETLNLVNPNGIEITLSAFDYHFPNNGKLLLIILITLFSISTILTGHYYCEVCVRFLNKKIPLFIVKFSTVISVFLGIFTSPSIIWKLVDVMVAIIAIINTTTLLKLKHQIKCCPK